MRRESSCLLFPLSTPIVISVYYRVNTVQHGGMSGVREPRRVTITTGHSQVMMGGHQRWRRRFPAQGSDNRMGERLHGGQGMGIFRMYTGADGKSVIEELSKDNPM